MTGEEVRWDGRKWRNRVHWQFSMTPLGEDEHGAWFAVPCGTLVQRGRDAAFHLPDGFVSLVPRGAWWQAEFYTSHPELEIYVNIGTPCEWRSGAIRQVDLDLDVVRRHGGGVETLDEDEFAEHQVELGYPPEVIALAEASRDRVHAAVLAEDPPYDGSHRRWQRVLDGLDGVTGRS